MNFPAAGTVLIVVSDTSPVLNLARIGRLELLHLLYKQVLIPSAVFAELTASKRDLPPAIDLASELWLIVASATDQQRVQELRENLDPGEAEAIVLAIEPCWRSSIIAYTETRASVSGPTCRRHTQPKRQRGANMRGIFVDELRYA